MKNTYFLRVFPLVIAAALTGCAIGPDFKRPDTSTAPEWHAPRPHDGSSAELRDWWRAWNDAALQRLIDEAQRNNPSVAQADARIRQARATARAQTALLLPGFEGKAQDTRSKGGNQGGNQSGNQTLQPSATGQLEAERVRGISLEAGWEIDLFGGGRRAREASSARATARHADWHDARVSVAAEVASQYVNLRACELLLSGYVIDTASRADTARLTDLKMNAGFESPANAALTRASAAEARARQTQQEADCQLVVKALAALTAIDEAALRVVLTPGRAQIPQPAAFAVAAIPAEALSQRPDLAAAESDLAASLADVGVAMADRLPRLSLVGSIGYQDYRNNSMGLSDGRSWSWGPSLSVPVFDFGRRAANVDQARARYDEALAQHRERVLRAVREVEEALVRLDSAARRDADARAALNGYENFLAATDARVRAGAGSLTELEEARRAVVAAQGVAVGVSRERLLAWISLYRTVGGGWNAADGRTTSASASSSPLLAKN